MPSVAKILVAALAGASASSNLTFTGIRPGGVYNLTEDAFPGRSASITGVPSDSSFKLSFGITAPVSADTTINIDGAKYPVVGEGWYNATKEGVQSAEDFFDQINWQSFGENPATVNVTATACVKEDCASQTGVYEFNPRLKAHAGALLSAHLRGASTHVAEANLTADS
ncbi:MAG: hypothetical protein Q7V63_09105 [Gammaproteobacteria bacterium]|nr:hypothetical protein [Gammaproteobacteria bacterium]